MVRLVRLILVVSLLCSAAGAKETIDLDAIQPDDLDTCDALVRDHPDELHAYLCYWHVADRRQQWSEAKRRLDALLAVDPKNEAAKLYLSLMVLRLGDEARGESLLRGALERFEAKGHARGQVYAGTSLAMLLRGQGRFDEAADVLSRVEGPANESGDPELIGQVLGQQAWHAYNTYDYGRAWSRFRQLEAMAFPSGTAQLQSWALSGLGSTAWATGRFRDALESYRREATILAAAGQPFQEASVRYNIALIAAQLRDQGGIARDEWTGLLREALDAAIRTGNRDAESGVRIRLAEILGGDEAIAEAERGLALARAVGSAAKTCWGLRALVRLHLARQPADLTTLRGWADEAVRLARSRADLKESALSLFSRASVHWAGGDAESALGEMLLGLDTVEQIRNLQPEPQVRARSFASWTGFYDQALTMMLLSGGDSPTAEEIDLAFGIGERLRSRVWLDDLDAAQATSRVGGATPLNEQRHAVLERIAEVQRGLFHEELGGAERAALLEELQELEDRERALRDELARGSRHFAALYRPTTPSLGLVQRAIAPDQALLAFQLPPGRSSDALERAWVFVITHDDARVVALDEVTELDQRVAAYRGLLERRDRFEPRAAARLYRDLLEPALDLLPETVSRLVVVPDGPLARLPVAALRPAAAAEPLAALYEIAVVPSASTWLHLKQGGSRRRRVSALSFADPPFPGALEEPGERSATWFNGLRLPRLPATRREATELLRAVGGPGVGRIGEEATEALLKQTDLAPYSILHLATHTVLDEEHPDRTAILLAPGDETEDGLLQVREIVELDLDGQLVILSGCSSASGALLPGEGVLGLSRAFFLAGAQTVVGGLWPLRDAEAALLIRDFARHLGRGASVGSALGAAQRGRIDAASPSAAWAGLVVLGDADWIPFPGGRTAGARRWTGWLAAGAATLLLGWLALRWRRRREL